MIGWFVLSILLYRTDDDLAAEAGHIIARSCAVAEQHVRAGLQPGQAVMFGDCVPYVPHAEVAAR